VREIAIIGVGELPAVVRDTAREEVELVQPVVTEALAQAGLDRREIGVTISGSCDYLLGRPFSFVAALDGVAPWPPIAESHVEMDGAWALHEAWVRLQCGDVDTALIYAYGKSSLGELRKVLAQQLDPYYLAPLGVDAIALAGLQARACGIDEPDLTLDVRDGACAVVLAAGDAAKKSPQRAWIRGIDHRIEPHSLGARDLTQSPSTRLAAEHAGARADDLAFLHAPFPFQESILKKELKLKRLAPRAPQPMIVAGLSRLAAAARAIFAGETERALAHATSGPCLQQNLVCVMEGDR
jgi:hypothetical protein